MNRTCIAVVLAAGNFLVADQVLSAVVDAGVDTTIRHHVFGAGSTAIYHPSTLVIINGDPSGGGTSELETRNISGSFDAELSRFWWEYDLGHSDHSTAVFEQYWLRLSNSNVTGSGDWAGFTLFHSFLRSEGASYASFSGNSNSCMFPMGPDTSCTGFFNGAAPSASGGMFGGELILDGIVPLDSYPYSPYYSYHIVATSVPIPAAAWLFFSSVAGLGFLSRRRAQ